MGVSSGQKWWRTVLEIEISCSQWEGWVGGGGGERRIFFIFLCSQHVLFKFSMGSPQVSTMFPRLSMRFPSVFPIASCFNPICFSPSPLLLTYIPGPKGEALHLYAESSILGSLCSFNFFVGVFLGWAHFSNWLIAKKKGWTCDAPPNN